MRFYGSNDLPQDLAKKSFAANIARVMPNGTAPLYALSGMAKKRTCLDIEHGYWTKKMQFLHITLDTAIADGTTTTFSVNSTDGVLKNQIIRIPKAFNSGSYVPPEFARVTSVDYGNNNITVERGFGNTTAATSIASGTKLAVPFNAQPEGSPKPASRAVVPERVMNYTQIFRNAWSQSRTLAAIKQVVGNGTVAENKEDAITFHSQEIEYATLFGRKYIGTDSETGEPIHMMDGLEAVIEEHSPSNLREAGATTNYEQLEEMLDPVLDFKTQSMSGNSRTIFCGKQALKTINNIGRLSGEYQLQDDQTNFGLSFKTFSTTRGRFNLVEHPLLNTNDDYAKMAFVVDLSQFDFLSLEGRDTQVEYINGDMKSTDGQDATGGIFTTELTTEIMNPFAHGVIYNLTAASA
jgi:hypothetical protein